LVNDKLQGHILEIIDNQMRDNDPKCTKEVFERLIGRNSICSYGSGKKYKKCCGK